jgi:hypothetical protein
MIQGRVGRAVLLGALCGLLPLFAGGAPKSESGGIGGLPSPGRGARRHDHADGPCGHRGHLGRALELQAKGRGLFGP